MDQKMFSGVAGLSSPWWRCSTLVRTYMDWPVMIGDWSVPMWVSWIGLREDRLLASDEEGRDHVIRQCRAAATPDRFGFHLAQAVGVALQRSWPRVRIVVPKLHPQQKSWSLFGRFRSPCRPRARLPWPGSASSAARRPWPRS